MIVLRESSFVAVPWKNGGGVTREIHRAGAQGSEFDWRLSLATIDRAGPFSSFEGYDRKLLLVRGAGVVLDFGAHGTKRLASPGQMAEFDGGWATTCELIDGTSTDLNLMVSQLRARAMCRVARVADSEVIQTLDGAETLVCCISGSVRIENTAGHSEVLASMDVTRGFSSDVALSCRTLSAEPACLFVATLWQRS